jgi:hypothetical protein
MFYVRHFNKLWHGCLFNNGFQFHIYIVCCIQSDFVVIYCYFIKNDGHKTCEVYEIYAKSVTTLFKIKVITKLPNSEQSYKGKVKTLFKYCYSDSRNL